mmetsp:Transcript_31848/g.59512  ORF Transcript_31848/g.59512 Transcript_31848/m.59512 type:complete len:285 (-) Transcript_31848:72-926(-)
MLLRQRLLTKGICPAEAVVGGATLTKTLGHGDRVTTLMRRRSPRGVAAAGHNAELEGSRQRPKLVPVRRHRRSRPAKIPSPRAEDARGGGASVQQRRKSRSKKNMRHRQGKVLAKGKVVLSLSPQQRARGAKPREKVVLSLSPQQRAARRVARKVMPLPTRRRSRTGLLCVSAGRAALLPKRRAHPAKQARARAKKAKRARKVRRARARPARPARARSRLQTKRIVARTALQAKVEKRGVESSSGGRKARRASSIQGFWHVSWPVAATIRDGTMTLSIATTWLQ